MDNIVLQVLPLVLFIGDDTMSRTALIIILACSLAMLLASALFYSYRKS